MKFAGKLFGEPHAIQERMEARKIANKTTRNELIREQKFQTKIHEISREFRIIKSQFGIVDFSHPEKVYGTPSRPSPLRAFSGLNRIHTSGNTSRAGSPTKSYNQSHASPGANIWITPSIQTPPRSCSRLSRSVSPTKPRFFSKDVSPVKIAFGSKIPVSSPCKASPIKKEKSLKKAMFRSRKVERVPPYIPSLLPPSIYTVQLTSILKHPRREYLKKKIDGAYIKISY